MVDEWLSTEQIARELGVTARWVRRQIEVQRLRARVFLTGGRHTYRIRRTHLDEFLRRYSRDTLDPFWRDE
jgi:excisionase family DNA binding protein